MTAQFPTNDDYKQVKEDDESSRQFAWSEELAHLPLRQRLKLLRANAVSENRKEFQIPERSAANHVVNKEDPWCDSLECLPDQDRGKGRASSASCGQRQCGSDAIRISEDFDEDLEHVSLKERQRMLSREKARSIRPAIEFKSSVPSTNPVMPHSANIYASSEASKPSFFNGNAAGARIRSSQREGTKLTKSRSFKNVYKEASPCSSNKSNIREKPLLSSTCKDDHTSALKPLPKVKVETLDCDLDIPNRSIGTQISIKDEAVTTAETLEDIIDHMILGDRMRLLASRNFSKTIVYEDCETGNDRKSQLSNSSKPFLIKRPRKRRRTATDSVETALEEDAPGLLKVLIEKGVVVGEIKLYGANEDDEPLDESLIDESFSDLENVITKIFSQQPSLFKFAPIRCGGGEKTSYCLACLISLVEQARYLRVKNWPVEWGWCRDLQSFIFVFNKHNRIVLERPEYGYATYFFELVDALPVNWQIKRLVTTMKLTSCTRLTLIENRALKVGSDLTEGEARVLMEYGWIPDTGLGTMLNYRDRVVHDRKNERDGDSSEWRSKIGKLLTDGYNGGMIVPNDIPKKVIEYGLGNTPEIKLEY